MAFDPYHKWLGISKKQRPVTYYRLLGVDPEETDDFVIEEAAIRQSAHLRSYQAGKDSDIATRLLEEISTARQTLLDKQKRKAYDAKLANQKNQEHTPSPFADIDLATTNSPQPNRKSTNNTMLYAAAGGGVAIALTAVLLLVFLPGEPDKAAKQHAAKSPSKVKKSRNQSQKIDKPKKPAKLVTPIKRKPIDKPSKKKTPKKQPATTKTAKKTPEKDLPKDNSTKVVAKTDAAANPLPNNPKPGQVWTNSLGMKFVWVPPGNFVMGSPQDEKRRRGNENPEKVTLKHGFWIGQTEVTQQHWETVMGSNPSQFKGSDLPAADMAWDDCRTFCIKLRKLSDKNYRLPTEAEWEYACRAGTTTAFCFGDDSNKLDQFGWWSRNSNKTTHSVAQLKPNPWGLFDMHGNVWECCLPGHIEDTDDIRALDESAIPLKMLRGGAYDFPASFCRSACRIRHLPNRRGNAIGCRVVFQEVH